MLSLIVCGVFSYLRNGVKYAAKCLHAQPLEKPGWAVNPTISVYFFVVFTWVFAESLGIARLSRFSKVGRSMIIKRITIQLNIWINEWATIWGAWLIAGLISQHLYWRIPLGFILLLPLGLIMIVPGYLIMHGLQRIALFVSERIG